MTLRGYVPLIARFRRSFCFLRCEIDSSSLLHSLSKRTRIPTKTLLPTIVLGTALTFLVLPKHTTNALSVILPLRRTINALDDEQVIDDRRKMWDYWFALCTTFVAELAGVEKVVGAYWPLKLATVLWVLAPEFAGCKRLRSVTGETSARQIQAISFVDTDHINRDISPQTVTPIKAPSLNRALSPSSSCSQWSARSTNDLVPLEVSPTSEPSKPKCFGTAKTLDDLLELELDDSDSEYVESPVDSSTCFPALLPPPNQKPSFSPGPAKTLDDLLELDFGAEVQRGQAHSPLLPRRREKLEVPLSPEGAFELDTTH